MSQVQTDNQIPKGNGSQNRRAILVLGMHRSGTSALSGVLNILGACLPKELMPASKYNAKGYFEGLNIASFHDSLLEQLGSRWDDPLPLLKTWPVSVKVDAEKALRALIQDEFGNHSISLIKDPRICRLLPIWLDALKDKGLEPVAVLCVRHPIEVSASVKTRNALTKPHALMLWLQHVLVSERETRLIPRSIIFYDDLLQDWRSAVEKISQNLSLRWPRQGDDVENQVDAFISPNLHHHKSPTIESLESDRLLDLCLQVWDTMKMLSSQLDVQANHKTLDGIFEEFSKIFEVSGPLIASAESNLKLTEKKLASIQRGIPQDWPEVLQDKDRHISNLDQQISNLSLSVSELHQVIADRSSKIESLEAQILVSDQNLTDLRKKADNLYQENTDANKRLGTYLRRIDNQSSDIRSLQNDLERQNNENIKSISALSHERDNLHNQLETVLMSSSWRVTHPLRTAGRILPRPIRRLLRRIVKLAYWTVTLRLSKNIAKHRHIQAQLAALEAARVESLMAPVQTNHSASDDTDYGQWIKDRESLTDNDRIAIRAQIAELVNPPTISIAMPTYDTDENLLRSAIMSVRQQIYPHWQLCIADDCSPSNHVVDILQSMASEDDRIVWMRRETNGNIAAASNSAVALAEGEFVALMDHDDLLPETALYEIATSICADRNVDVIYSDEDHIDDNGKRSSPYFKPDWDEFLLYGQNFVNHLGVYRRSLLQEVGGFRIGFEGSQDHDLALRATAVAGPSRVRHLGKILYHWRQSKNENSFSQTRLDQCVSSARRAVEDHLVRKGINGAVVTASTLVPSWNRVILPLPEPAPLVSIIIPTRDNVEILRRCIAGVLHRTDYPNVEIIIADNGSSEKETMEYFSLCQQDRRVRVLPVPMPFNYSAINNHAIRESKGDVIVLLNNDIDVIGPDWLREMVSIAMLPDVGCVGAKLLYGDGTIQHAGVLLGAGTFDGKQGVAGHFGSRLARETVGYFGQYALTRELSAVTAACAVLRRDVFDSVEGFDEVNLPVAFNDVDLCLRIREKGYRIIWTPFAELYHLESASRGSDLAPEKVERFHRECRYMRQRWGNTLDNDPFYSLVFDREHGDAGIFSKAFAPKTWELVIPSGKDQDKSFT